MNFRDKDIREQVAIAEKQMNAIHDHLRDFIQQNEIDPAVSMAAILSILAKSIAVEAGHDIAKQDACVAFMVKALYVSMAENGFRPMEDSMADAIPPWDKN